MKPAQPPRVLVGIASHRGWLRAELTMSLLQAAPVLAQHGVEMAVSVQQGAVCPIARNRLVAAALACEASHLLMVDDDQAFPPDAPLRLLAWQEDVVAAAVPSRHDARFVIVEPAAVPGRAPLLEVLVAGTCFVLISRACLERMTAAYGAHVFTNGHPDRGMPGWSDPDAAVGEDTGFSLRWRGLGGRIFCDPTISIDHYGLACASGSMADALRAGPVQMANGEIFTASQLGLASRPSGAPAPAQKAEQEAA